MPRMWRCIGALLPHLQATTRYLQSQRQPGASPAVAAFRAEWERLNRADTIYPLEPIRSLVERLLAALGEAEQEYARCYAGLTAERLAVENRDKRGEAE